MSKQVEVPEGVKVVEVAAPGGALTGMIRVSDLPVIYKHFCDRLLSDEAVERFDLRPLRNSGYQLVPRPEGEFMRFVDAGKVVSRLRQALLWIASRPIPERSPDGIDQAAESMQLAAREALGPSDSQGDQERCGRCGDKRETVLAEPDGQSPERTYVAPCPDCNPAPTRWKVGQLLRHPSGGEWEIREHLGGENDDFRCRQVVGSDRCDLTGAERVFHREYMDRTFKVVPDPAPTQVEGDPELSALFADVDLDLRPEALRQADPDAYAKACKLRRQPEGGDEEDWPASADLIRFEGDPPDELRVLPAILEGRDTDLDDRKFERRRYLPATSQDSSGLEEKLAIAEGQREVHRRNNERLLEEDRKLREELIAERDRASKAEAERAANRADALANLDALEKHRQARVRAETALEELAEEFQCRAAEHGPHPMVTNTYLAVASLAREKAAELKGDRDA